jgi:hypothetical protein
MHNRWCAAVAALLLGAGSASAQEARFDPDPLAVLVVPADAQPVAPLAAPPGVSVDAFSGPLLFAGAEEVTSPFTLFSGIALRGVTARDLFGVGDLLETGLRAGYGVVEVDLEAAVREEFVIIAGGEPFALTGSNPITGTERLGMLAVTADLLYAWPPAGPVVPFVAAGAGFVHLIGDRGEQNAAFRLAAGLEWRVNPAFAVTLEASDLLFTAKVLGRGVVQAWGVMAGVRWRF